MSRYIDIHTHRPTALHIEPQAVGIHPWMAEKVVFDEAIFDNAAAVGEIGLDFACDVNRDTQERVFRAQLAQAEKRNLPVILHCVRAFEPIMKILAEYNLRAVIFHGFIGSVEQARQAVNRGYFLSFGERTFHSSKTIKALQETPLDHIFVESDTSRMPLEEIYAKIAEIFSTEPHKLAKQIDENFEQLFSDC